MVTDYDESLGYDADHEPDFIVWVCGDCYVAHHYGARCVTREATDREVDDYLSGYAAVATAHLGKTFRETPEGLEVTEWFSGDSDARCCGGEPLAELPDVCFAVRRPVRVHGHGPESRNNDGHPVHWFDFTCSNHDVDEPEDTCPHCERSGHESGIDEFSSSPCHGCGSHLGGARYRLAGFIRKEATT